MSAGIRVGTEPTDFDSGSYVEALLLKLQADIAARKRPRREVKPLLKVVSSTDRNVPRIQRIEMSPGFEG
ncbi:MAG: hypothetical protein GEU90_03975 [Gemmatimonas sp.]|nr:hypothetical protein [Gemmatimonas sp.]